MDSGKVLSTKAKVDSFGIIMDDNSTVLARARPGKGDQSPLPGSAEDSVSVTFTKANPSCFRLIHCRGSRALGLDLPNPHILSLRLASTNTLGAVVTWQLIDKAS